MKTLAKAAPFGRLCLIWINYLVGVGTDAGVGVGTVTSTEGPVLGTPGALPNAEKTIQATTNSATTANTAQNTPYPDESRSIILSAMRPLYRGVD